MRRLGILIASILAVAAPNAAIAATEHGGGHGAEPGPPAADGTHAVAIAGRAFAPARVSALEGDTVAWRNDDFMVHNVTSSTAGFASPSLARGGSFTHRFATAGSYSYVCTLHPFMTGRVDVHTALLEAAAEHVLAGQEVALHGRAPAGSAVTIEHRPAGAGAFTALTTLATGADGRFHGSVRPTTTAVYRAVTDRGAGPEVTVTVASKLAVALAVRSGRRYTRVRVTAPGAPHAVATLQLYSRERFSWRDRRRARLDATGRATFRLRAGIRTRARVVVSRPDGVELGVSSAVKLPGDGRRPGSRGPESR